MKTHRFRKYLVFFITYAVFTGCTAAKLIEYSSTAGADQKFTHVRTEMQIIKGDDETISRNFHVLAAVDYLQDGKKNYYLIIVPTLTSGANPKVDDMLLYYEYPFIMQGNAVGDITKNLEKIVNEWESLDLKYSGAVYNLFLSSSQTVSTVAENRFFESTPYIKFNYSKTANGAIARLALGFRTEEIVNSTVDGKVVKSRSFVRDDEMFWVLDKSAQVKDFLTLLNKGLVELRERGMEGSSKKKDDRDSDRDKQRENERKKEEERLKEEAAIKDKQVEDQVIDTDVKEKTRKKDTTKKKKKKK